MKVQTNVITYNRSIQDPIKNREGPSGNGMVLQTLIKI